MITPTKHVPPGRALLTIGASVLTLCDPTPRSSNANASATELRKSPTPPRASHALNAARSAANSRRRSPPTRGRTARTPTMSRRTSRPVLDSTSAFLHPIDEVCSALRCASAQPAPVRVRLARRGRRRDVTSSPSRARPTRPGESSRRGRPGRPQDARSVPCADRRRSRYPVACRRQARSRRPGRTRCRATTRPS